eukprot:CAMPEP_0181210292 /NCGR_PEP_ID=MMETSP1096-20121128/23147_1 /TAXON_ID=156174 ORGANISM="Chrysochromulina ericina, Strain CCMP281" /NCGR_SAMPLE_ID=MMETSP1096 /ASSEMBLY_ACC=CAM_ASM_000453 /LENGTH=117 /DNA_ID=CAMNT_0023301561 /DNA_START=311 /DNA_END=664 /DNA_ORIENTATION=-
MTLPYVLRARLRSVSWGGGDSTDSCACQHLCFAQAHIAARDRMLAGRAHDTQKYELDAGGTVMQKSSFRRHVRISSHETTTAAASPRRSTKDNLPYSRCSLPQKTPGSTSCTFAPTS